MTIACACISRASSTIRRPAWPGADLLVVAGDPAAALEPRLLDDRLGGELLLGHLGRDRRRAGTVIVTSTWMPRRRRAATLTAVASAPSEYCLTSNATSTDSYSASCSTTGFGIATFVVVVRSRP